MSINVFTATTTDSTEKFFYRVNGGITITCLEKEGKKLTYFKFTSRVEQSVKNKDQTITYSDIAPHLLHKMFKQDQYTFHSKAGSPFVNAGKLFAEHLQLQNLTDQDCAVLYMTLVALGIRHGWNKLEKGISHSKLLGTIKIYLGFALPTTDALLSYFADFADKFFKARKSHEEKPLVTVVESKPKKPFSKQNKGKKPYLGKKKPNVAAPVAPAEVVDWSEIPDDGTVDTSSQEVGGQQTS